MARLTQCIDRLDTGIAHVGDAIPGMPLTEAVLARLLMLVGGSVQQELERGLKPRKLSDSDFLTLVTLFSRPDGSSSPGELCEHTSQSPTNMTRITNVLVKRGLISRGVSATDRRRVLIRITAAGRRFVRQMLPPLFPSLLMTFSGFSDNDKRQLSRLLRKLSRNLDQMDIDATS